MSDKEIVSLILKDASNGMKLLIDQFSPIVYGTVRGRLCQVCSHDEIDACVNHVFTDFYFNINKFDVKKCSIKTYLTVLARNKAIEEFRKHSRHIGEICSDSDELIELPDAFNLENVAERHILEERLLLAVKMLGTPDSQIIIRRYFYAQPSKLIAEALGMTDAAVRKHISRSLAKLKTMLDKQQQ